MRKNLKKIILTGSLSLMMMFTMSPSQVSAKVDGMDYGKEESVSSIIEDAEINVYVTQGDGKFGGSISIDKMNILGTFPMLSGYRQFTATANEGWVFKGWDTWISKNEGLITHSEENRRGTSGDYSYSNASDNWKDKYNGSGATISANRLGTWGETVFSPIVYDMWANFNPTVTAKADTNGAITEEGTIEVEYGTGKAYTITADAGYIITKIIDNDTTVDIASDCLTTYTYEIASVKSPHTITFETAKVFNVTYTDGVDGKELFADQVTENILEGAATPEFVGEKEREGYVFYGWNPEVAEKVTADKTYVATWEEDVNGNDTADKDEVKFTVTYKDGVDEEVFEDQVTMNILSGTATPAFVGEKERAGYVFYGWDSEIADEVTVDATYVAVWEEDVNGNDIADKDEDKYTVIYTDGVDGEEVFADQVTEGILDGMDTPKFDGTPVRKGYVFDGWEPEVSLTVVSDVTYTATWKVADKEDETVKTGDSSNYALYIILATLSLSVIGATVFMSRRKIR